LFQASIELIRLAPVQLQKRPKPPSKAESSVAALFINSNSLAVSKPASQLVGIQRSQLRALDAAVRPDQHAVRQGTDGVAEAQGRLRIGIDADQDRVIHRRALQIVAHGLRLVQRHADDAY